MNYDIIDPGGQPPQVGDIIVTARLVRQVVEVRPVESRVWHDRWRLTLKRLGPRDPWPAEAVDQAVKAGAEVHHVERYRPGETPSDVARSLGLPVRAG